MRNKAKVAVLGVLFLLLGPLVGAAHATPDDSGIVSRFDGPVAYGFWADGLLVLVGGTAEDFCTFSESPTEPGGVLINLPTGEFIGFQRSNVPVSVYEYSGPDLSPENPSGGFELVADNCGAIFDDDPTTVPIEPLATGEARLQIVYRRSDDGTFEIRSSTVGRLEAADGDAAHLDTFEKITLGTDGLTVIGVDQARVRYID